MAIHMQSEDHTLLGHCHIIITHHIYIKLSKAKQHPYHLKYVFFFVKVVTRFTAFIQRPLKSRERVNSLSVVSQRYPRVLYRPYPALSYLRSVPRCLVSHRNGIYRSRLN
jgi:hypothetical protein